MIAEAPSESDESDAPDSGPPTPGVPELVEIREPDPAACRLTAAEWDFRDLRLSADGGRFASVIHAPVTLFVPVSETAREVVAAFDDGVRIRLVARAGDLALYTKLPRPLLGIVTPESDAPLGLDSASPGVLHVLFDAGQVLATPAPVKEELGCADLAIVPEKFDARASVTKRRNLPKRWVAREGAPIAAERGGSGVGTLESGVEVGVLETRGAMSRVIASGSSFVVSGWVATKDLTASPSGRIGYGRGIGKLAPYGVAHRALPSCVHELSLIGALGNERAVIGRIPPGTPYRVVEGSPTTDRLVRVELPYSVWLRLDGAARLLVHATELETCRPKPRSAE